MKKSGLENGQGEEKTNSSERRRQKSSGRKRRRGERGESSDAVELSRPPRGDISTADAPRPAESKKAVNDDPAASKKRRRRRTATSTENDGSLVSGGKRARRPLNGLTVCVSTLDVRGKQHAVVEDSYKSVSCLCKAAGASVAGQVHKRVHAVVCVETAAANATQRVRKALKKGVPIVSVSWVRECIAEGTRLEMGPHLLTKVAQEASRLKKTAGSSDEVDAQRSDEERMANDDAGWSNPVHLGCCCVCHENGDPKCEWCVDCDINIAAREHAKKTAVAAG